MSFGRFVKSLLPSFERVRIEDDIKTIKEELGDASLLPYKAASEHFDDHPFISKENKDYNSLFLREVKVGRKVKGDNYVRTTYNALEKAFSTLPIVENRIDDLFGKDITAEGMTFARANAIRYIGILYFATRYARRLLLLTYANEKEASGRGGESPFSPAEYDWMVEHQREFFHAVRIISYDDKELRTMLTNIPDMVIIPEEEKNVEETVGLGKLDPMKMNLIRPIVNPIYLVRMAYTDFLVSRYKIAQEEKRALEYRLLSLKEITQGRDDPKLEQQIEYTENRVRKLNRKLSKMEED